MQMEVGQSRPVGMSRPRPRWWLAWAGRGQIRAGLARGSGGVALGSWEEEKRGPVGPRRRGGGLDEKEKEKENL